MLYITSLALIYLVTKSLYLLTTFLQFSLPSMYLTAFLIQSSISRSYVFISLIFALHTLSLLPMFCLRTISTNALLIMDYPIASNTVVYGENIEFNWLKQKNMTQDSIPSSFIFLTTLIRIFIMLIWVFPSLALGHKSLVLGLVTTLFLKRTRVTTEHTMLIQWTVYSLAFEYTLSTKLEYFLLPPRKKT